jgi:hypothetical protein
MNRLLRDKHLIAVHAAQGCGRGMSGDPAINATIGWGLLAVLGRAAPGLLEFRVSVLTSTHAA